MVLGIILSVLLIRGIMADISSKAYYKGEKRVSENEFWIVFFFGICGVLILILKKLKNN